VFGEFSAMGHIMISSTFPSLRLSAVALALSLGVAACGAEDESATEQDSTLQPEALQGFFTTKWYITSNTNQMSINAWGGAQEGAKIMLHEACTKQNQDCQFFFDQDKMVRSVKQPQLALNALNGVRDQAELVLTAACTPQNSDCLWDYNHLTGVLKPLNNSTLMVNAWGGAKHGAALKLTNLCTPSNPDCTWKAEQLF
jgi:hypothetical protein